MFIFSFNSTALILQIASFTICPEDVGSGAIVGSAMGVSAAPFSILTGKGLSAKNLLVSVTFHPPNQTLHYWSDSPCRHWSVLHPRRHARDGKTEKEFAHPCCHCSIFDLCWL